MNTEKVRSALQRAGMLLASQSYHTDYIEEALAELEKLAEDVTDFDVASAIDILKVNGFGLVHSDDIQNVVEKLKSYHAKKCAECVGNLPAFPHRTEAPRA